MLIDCDTCRARGPACGDCVVSVLVGPPRDAALDTVIDPAADSDQRVALAVLAGSGLVPPLRLVRDPADDDGPAGRDAAGPAGGRGRREAAG